VALARALANRPAVLLLDEPLGALDLKLRKGLQVQLKQIQRDVGITFVYVTHDQEEALTMSDRIAVMNRGVLEQVDGPEEIYERPRTTFVAGFIGVSNLMPAEVLSVDGSAVRVRLGAGQEVGAPESQGLTAGERCHAVVRPEKLELLAVGDAASPGHPSIEGTIQSTLYLGTATQIDVLVGGGSTLTVLVPNADNAVRRSLPGAGDAVRLGWAPEHMHLVREPAAAEQPAPNAPTEQEAVT